MADRLNGLRFDTVIGSHNQNNKIRHLRAPRTHCAKCLVSGGIQKGHGPLVGGNPISANMLSNSACLAGSDFCFSEVIQQGRLTVINMPHHRYHGRPRSTWPVV